MPRQLDPLLRDILEKHGEDPRDTKGVVWDCHGTWVIYHHALERVAARAGIRFDPPAVLEANGPGKCAALCVVGHMGDRADWSIGEAAPGNNKNSYPFAMAEKRARGRVILKLIGLSGLAYSEDEADDFKEPPRAAPEPAKAALRTVDTESNEQIRDMIDEKLTAATSVAELEAISKRLRPEFLRLPDAMREAIGQVYDFKRQALIAFSEERAA